MPIFILIIFQLFTVISFSQDLSVYETHKFTNNNFTLPYRLLRPINADPSVKYPLIVFLHGAGHKGTDNQVQLNLGGYFFMRDSIRKNYPAYILFPQCPEEDLWAYFDSYLDSFSHSYKINFPFKKEPTTVTAALKKLLDSLMSENKIDNSRIYIGGLSQGAMGVLDMLARYPDIFAAGFSICGAGKINTCQNFAGKSSLWLFHGAIDDVIPVSYSQDYYRKLKKLKADVRYTEYPGVKHNSWTNAFAEPELMSWLFSKKK